jgi:hypothetical protein
MIEKINLKNTKIILFLQRKFLFKKLIKEIENNETYLEALNSFTKEPQYINLFDPEKDKEILFNQLKKTVTIPQLIYGINNFLAVHYRYAGFDNEIAPKIDAKKFLIAWIIVSFPEYVLGTANPKKDENFNDKKYIYPYDIYFISLNFIKDLNILVTNKFATTLDQIRQFKKSFNMYSNAINYFLNRDKSEQIQSLFTEFININTTINDIKKSNKYTDPLIRSETIQIVTNTKLKIAAYLNKLDNTICLRDLEIQSKLYDKIGTECEKAMCDLLVVDIENKNFSYLEKIIDEVTKYLIELGASKVDHDFEKKINKNIIIQKLAFSGATRQNIAEYGDYIISIINDLQAPIQISTTNTSWETLKNKFENKNELLCNMLLFFFKEIKEIYYAVRDFGSAIKFVEPKSLFRN